MGTSIVSPGSIRKSVLAGRHAHACVIRIQMALMPVFVTGNLARIVSPPLIRPKSKTESLHINGPLLLRAGKASRFAISTQLEDVVCCALTPKRPKAAKVIAVTMTTAAACSQSRFMPLRITRRSVAKCNSCATTEKDRKRCQDDFIGFFHGAHRAKQIFLTPFLVLFLSARRIASTRASASNFSATN
jgi:hypothetical protein